MAVLAFLLSVTFAALGTVGVISPHRLFDFTRRFEASAGLYTAPVCLVFGWMLLFAAPASRAPQIISALGIIIFMVGLAAPQGNVRIDWVGGR